MGTTGNTGKLSKVTLQAEGEDVRRLLDRWIDADSWLESQELLKANAELLLSDEALAELDKLLAKCDSMDLTGVLLQHREILETARLTSIDEAYEELRRPAQVLSTELLRADSAEQLQRVLERYPVLHEADTLNALSALAASMKRAGDAGGARALWGRLQTLQALLELEGQRAQASARELDQQGARQAGELDQQHEEALYTLIEFANADWPTRREMLQERPDVLMHESVESLLDALLTEGADGATVAWLRTLLQRCRTWGVNPVLYFELSMRLGDDIAIPSQFEDTVMCAAMLLSLRRKQDTALEQAVEMLQALLDRLTGEFSALFEGALLRDVADAMRALPIDHPLRKLNVIENYYREALPIYQAEQRPISEAFIQRAIGEVLCEQGRYSEALEPLSEAMTGFREHGRYKNDIAWTLSSRASALDILGQTEDALSDLDEAIQFLPSTAPLYRNRAETLIHVRRLDEAEADLQRAAFLDRNEDSVLLWYRRAQLALARGNSMLAIRMLDEVLERDPAYNVAFLQAQCNWLLGDLAAAVGDIQEAFGHATPGERVFMRREMERLRSDYPELEPLI